MKEFSLVINDGFLVQDVPQGPVILFGNDRRAVAYSDYDGRMDRVCPSEIQGEWFPLGTDFDSINAWHGERKVIGRVYHGKITWRKQ